MIMVMHTFGVSNRASRFCHLIQSTRAAKTAGNGVTVRALETRLLAVENSWPPDEFWSRGMLAAVTVRTQHL